MASRCAAISRSARRWSGSVDFGHAPIYRGRCSLRIVVLRKRGEEEAAPPAGETEVCLFPREALGRAQIGGYIDANSYPVPMARFGAQPWSLNRARWTRS